jgi:hypothetical protein
MSDPNLLHMLRLFLPSQIAVDISINPLPSVIISFIFSLVQNPPEMTPSQKELPKMPSDPGNDGSSSVNKSELQTHYLLTLKSRTGTGSLAHFVKPCVKEPSPPEGTRNSSSVRAEPPWTTWHRPSRLWTDPTHNVTTPETLYSFYSDNIVDIETPISAKCNKKRSRQTA